MNNTIKLNEKIYFYSVLKKGSLQHAYGNAVSFTTLAAPEPPAITHLRGLMPETTYFVRACATNSEGTAYGNPVSFQTRERTITYGQGLTDIDGNVYTTVIIGEQEWMAQNLRTTRYDDGTSIPAGHSDAQWMSLTTGGYAVYPHSLIEDLNTEAEVLQTYGALLTSLLS